ncbi:MAG: hypothetical protein ABJB40_06740, partial [Acidobacteriota bacterium]
QKHEAHLLGFLRAIDEVAELVPENSLVIANRGMGKFLGTPAMRPPPVDLLVYNYIGDESAGGKIAAANGRPWFIVFLGKTPQQEMPPAFDELVLKFNMTRVETASPNLAVYRVGQATER